MVRNGKNGQNANFAQSFSVLAPKITTDKNFQVHIIIFLNDVTSSDVTSSIYKIADVSKFLTSQICFLVFSEKVNVGLYSCEVSSCFHQFCGF